MTAEEKWIEDNTYLCVRMSARITKAKCEKNMRGGYCLSCENCAGVAGMMKQGICVKCDREIAIAAKGLCWTCAYGAGATLTRETVLARVASGVYAPVGGDRRSGTTPKKSSGLASLLSYKGKLSPSTITLDFTGQEELFTTLQSHNVTGPEIINVLALIATGNYELRRK
jgi:hypothetical protein